MVSNISQAKDSVRNTSEITSVTKFPLSHDTALPQIVTFAAMEKERGQKEGIRKIKV